MSATAVVERWARATDARLRGVFREAAQDVAENVKVGGQFSPGTPVDTGFARSNWGAALNDTDPSGGGNETALTIASADLGDTITLYNNTEYLPYLEDGSTTPRAPFVSGWIAQTVHAWPTIVAQAVARVRGAVR
jgi:hypothetical protein